MRILITGGEGQLGQALRVALSDHVLTSIDLPEVDICDRPVLEELVERTRPELIIHCAAYTDVDGSAKDPMLAYRVNGLGTQNVALACRLVGAELIHISTNEVFSGNKPTGYDEWMVPDPTNAYGRSKAAGEAFVRDLLDRNMIVRTAWLYGHGGHNFVHAILRRAQDGHQLRVVADEVGNPTYVKDLAEAISRIIGTGQYGTYHLVNAGSCSRWSFANEILRLAGLEHVENSPILARDYRRASSPPPYGVLNNLSAAAIGIRLRPWQEALADFFEERPPLGIR